MKKYIYLTLTILCLIFIYGNSLLDADASSELSGFIGGLIGVIAEIFDVRKLAHFVQFAVLGFLVTVTTKAWLGKLKPHIFMILFAGLAVAVSDEFLQLFPEGRVAAVEDVVLDFSGYIVGLLFYLGISLLAKCKCTKRCTRM